MTDAAYKFQTIQARHVAKHLDRISNIRVWTLENHFCGEAINLPAAHALDFALNKFGAKLQVNKTTGKARIRLHSNCWYEMDYRTDAVEG